MMLSAGLPLALDVRRHGGVACRLRKSPSTAQGPAATRLPSSAAFRQLSGSRGLAGGVGRPVQAQKRRGISVIAAAASPDPPPPTEEDAPKKKDLTNDLAAKIVKSQYSEEYAKRILANLKSLGLDSVEKKEDIQKFFVSRSVAKLLPNGLSALLNALACYVCFLGYALARSRGEDLGFLSFPSQALCITFGLNFAIETISESVLFVNTLAAAVVFGTNVETFLQAVREQAGIKEKEMSLWEKALAAVSAVKVVEALTSIRDRARSFVRDEEVAIGAAPASPQDARESYYKLAALLAVWDASRLKKFDPREWEMTEKEAVRIAKVFIKYDSDSNGRLDVFELRALTRDLGHELSEAEAAVALKYLDEDENGTVEFNEFVGWWTGVRSVNGGRAGLGGEAPAPPKMELPPLDGGAAAAAGAPPAAAEETREEAGAGTSSRRR